MLFYIKDASSWGRIFNGRKKIKYSSQVRMSSKNYKKKRKNHNLFLNHRRFYTHLDKTGFVVRLIRPMTKTAKTFKVAEGQESLWPCKWILEHNHPTNNRAEYFIKFAADSQPSQSMYKIVISRNSWKITNIKAHIYFLFTKHTTHILRWYTWMYLTIFFPFDSYFWKWKCECISSMFM